MVRVVVERDVAGGGCCNSCDGCDGGRGRRRVGGSGRYVEPE